MCIFSGGDRALSVSHTRIFACRQGERQVLVYAMRLDAPNEVAMILPLPVTAGAGEDAVRFHDLSPVPDFFDRLEACMPVMRGRRSAEARPRLAVRQVGAFEASYVPSTADFDRLDPRFRLSESIWQALPHYADWGFAVFQFRPGALDVHPMALDFPARVPGALFFPTVHVHDGELRRHAEFEHTLYLQGLCRSRHLEQVLGVAQPNWWRRAPPIEGSETTPREHFGGPGTGELVDLDAPLSRLRLAGKFLNTDIWLMEDPSDPADNAKQPSGGGGGRRRWFRWPW